MARSDFNNYNGGVERSVFTPSPNGEQWIMDQLELDNISRKYGGLKETEYVTPTNGGYGNNEAHLNAMQHALDVAQTLRNNGFQGINGDSILEEYFKQVKEQNGLDEGQLLYLRAKAGLIDDNGLYLDRRNSEKQLENNFNENVRTNGFSKDAYDELQNSVGNLRDAYFKELDRRRGFN